MESNYVKSARIKLERLQIKYGNDYIKYRQEIYDIISEYVNKELLRRINEHDWTSSTYYQTFVNDRGITLEPERKPWHVQTFDYYTRIPERSKLKYERPKQTLQLLQ